VSLKQTFKAVSGFFTREHIEYAVIGAFALYGYGYVRATRDIDFIIRLKDKRKAIVFLESIGFETLHASDSFSNHLHPVGSTRVDLMFAEGSTADAIFSACENKLVLDDVPVPVVSAEHLIAMKLFSAHNNPDRLFKDLGDVRELIVRSGISPLLIKKHFVKYGMEKYFDDSTRAPKQ
jgi:hypothetical protein